MRRTAALAATAALAVAGCGGSNKPAATPAPTEAATTAAPTDTPAQQAATGASELKIAADPSGALAFTQKDLTAKAGKVTIQFANKSQVPHAVAIEGNGVEDKTETVTGADAPPLTVDLKPGTYTFYCPVDGHRAAGMEGKLVVR